MSTVFGIIERLIIEDEPNEDGWLEIVIAVMSSDVEYTVDYLDKEEAIKLIAHLSKVFSIDLSDIE